MKMVRRILLAVGVATSVLTASGCGGEDLAGELASCGGIQLPDEYSVVAVYRKDVGFPSDRLLEAVVEIHESDVETFRTASGLAEYRTGIPAYSVSGYWSSGDVAGRFSLNSRDRYAEDAAGTRSRWVVVQDVKPDAQRVFIRALC